MEKSGRQNKRENNAITPTLANRNLSSTSFHENRGAMIAFAKNIFHGYKNQNVTQFIGFFTQF